MLIPPPRARSFFRYGSVVSIAKSARFSARGGIERAFLFSPVSASRSMAEEIRERVSSNRAERARRVTVKQVHYSGEWFTRILLSAPGVQRSYLRFHPVAPALPPLALFTEKGLGFYFSNA